MIIIQDNILPRDLLIGIRQSALESGFGTWSPPSHTFGSGVYRNMNWKGHNAALHIAVSKTLNQPIYPNQSFFRVLDENEEPRLIHSDRNDGSLTAIIYLSEHDHVRHGTGFYSHRETGLREMPPPAEMDTVKWDSEMQDINKWEEIDFVRGLFGRLLVFSAPLFHGRFPEQGFGTTPEDSRMIWVCHFEI